MNFLFVLYFFGILLAVFQDIKRREVDDWLNLSLFLSGTAYLIFSLNDFSIASYVFFAFCMALLSFLLYNGRFFAGGDAKLVFALTPLFYDSVFSRSIEDFSVFFIFLIFAGAFYGLLFILYLFFKDFGKIKEDLKVRFRKNVFVKYFFVLVLIFLFLGFFDSVFFILSIAFFIVISLFFLSKSLETISFTVEKNYFDLQEGDWLRQDVKIGKRVIKASWEGLSKEDIVFLRKSKKNVIVKEGIPYVPAFFIAFILYFFKAELVRYFLGF